MTKESTLTSSQEIEMMILGCMLNSQEHLRIAQSAVKEDDFEDKKHRAIFRSIKAKNVPDITLVSEKLKSDGYFQEVGGFAYLTTLSQHAGPATHIEAYCEELRQHSLKRSLLSLQKSVLDDLATGINPHIALEKLSAKIENIKAEKPIADSLYSHLLVPTSEQEISKEIKNISPGAIVGMKLGDVDFQVPGGALTIVAGATGHGKTLLMINMLLNYLELNPGKKVWFFSYEESRASIISLFLNTYINETLSGNNRRTIKSYFRDENVQFVSEPMRNDFLTKKNKFFDDLINTGRLNIFYCDFSIEMLNTALRFLKSKSDVGLIAIDYMQLLRHSSIKTTQRHEELKQICQVAKDCAVDTGLPILLAAQFNRTVVNEATMNKMAIGEAGDIERSAHTIIGLWNRNENESSDVANLGRRNQKFPKESAIYLELLKSREEGIGHSSTFDLNGKTGKLSAQQKKQGLNF
jgi:replicative DNA helicase